MSDVWGQGSFFALGKKLPWTESTSWNAFNLWTHKMFGKCWMKVGYHNGLCLIFFQKKDSPKKSTQQKKGKLSWDGRSMNVFIQFLLANVCFFETTILLMFLQGGCQLDSPHGEQPPKSNRRNYFRFLLIPRNRNVGSESSCTNGCMISNRKSCVCCSRAFWISHCWMFYTQDPGYFFGQGEF